MKYKELSQYRNVWLGFAMLWIMLYHSGISFDALPFNAVKAPGYGGVDICLFASGMGCFTSLTKNSDILDFMKRRFMRIAPTYAAFMVLWLIYAKVTANIGAGVALGNILGIRYLANADDAFNWYISALILLYIAAPYFKAIIDRTGTRGYVLTLVIMLAASLVFWNNGTYIIIVTRVPIFFIGMLAGKLCADKDAAVKPMHVGLLCGASAVGFALLYVFHRCFDTLLWSCGLYWYPFILITPGLCLVISCFARLLTKSGWSAWLEKFLAVIGKYSFELYLLHIPVFFVAEAVIVKFGLEKYTNILWAAVFAAMPLGCLCFKLYMKLLAMPIKALKGRK